MLRSRTVLSILRETPLQANIWRTPVRHFTRTSPFLQPSRQHHRVISTTRSTTKSPLLSAVWRASPARHLRNRRLNSTRPSPPQAQEAGSQQSHSVSGRFKELSKKYGWAAVGVYLGLSVLDFPFCFLAVQLVGPDRIGEIEHAIVDAFWSVVGVVMPSMKPEDREAVGDLEAEARETHSVELHGHKSKENASIWTQLLLAYGVHKSLIFFRVPLTAAVTPKVVKTLRGWGWDIAPRMPRRRRAQ